MVGVKGVGGIITILVLSEDILGDLWVWDNWLQSGRMILCRIAFLGAGVCFFGGVSKSIKIAVSNWERGGAFVWEQELGAILYCCVAEFDNCRAGFDIVKLSFSKCAGWPVGFGAINIVKRCLKLSQLIPITTTSSAKWCSVWIDETQVWLYAAWLYVNYV